MKNKKNCIVISIISIISVMFFLLLFWQIRIRVCRVNEESIVEAGDAFIMPYNEVTGIGICYDGIDEALSEENNIVISIVNMSTDEIEYSISLESFSFGNDVSKKRIEILNENIDADKNSEYFVTVQDENGEEIEDISVGVFGREKSIVKYYIFVAIMIITVVIVACGLFIFSRNNSFVLKYIVVFTMLSLLWNFSFAPLNAPDEETHFLTAYSLSNDMLGLNTYDGLVHMGSEYKHLSRTGNMQYMCNFWNDTLLSNNSVDMVEGAGKLINIKLPYYLPAMAITIARIFELQYKWIVMAGRIANLLFFILILSISMELIPRKYRYLFAGISFLPGVTSIASSYSYDIWNYALIFFLISYCLYCREKRKSVSIEDMIIICAITFFLTPVKVIYLIMAFAIFLIPTEKFKNRISQIIFVFFDFLLGIVSIILLRMDAVLGVANIGGKSASADISYCPVISIASVEISTQRKYYVGYIIEHPLKTVFVYAEELFKETDYLIKQSIVGNENTKLATPEIICYSMLIIIILIAMQTLPRNYLRKRERQLCIAWLGLCVLFIFTVMLLACSFIEDGIGGTIYGVQGRYFTPLLMIFPFIFQTSKLRLTDNENRLLLVSLPILNIFTLLCTFAYVAFK